MAEIIAAYGTSHTGMTIRKYDPDIASQVRVRAAFDQLKNEIEALAPDLIVMVNSDHLNSFFFDCFPQVCIGVGKQSIGWGDAGVASRIVPVAGDFAAHILKYGIEDGFDLSWADEPKLDHGFMSQLSLLTPQMNIPIIPIFQNASTPPLPPLKRCREFGRMIRKAIEARESDERIILLAGGGLSHWVATPEMGDIATSFDQWFLQCVVDGNIDALVGLDVVDIGERAGNGGQEIRNWITVMAAASGQGEVLCYEPVKQWATGMALARIFKQ